VSAQNPSKRDRIRGGIKADTLELKTHSPKKSAIYSAIFPGAGQFYNKRYWKMPIIYAGLFITGGFIADNNKLYNDYKAEAINRYNYDIVDAYPNLSDQEVLNNMDYYEKRRNINILILLGVYVLQIVDATVDAHFFSFDVNEDLSFRAEPFIHQSAFNSTAPINTGLTLSLKF
jgi:TM2 domain-containing membrane protein YozV